ncbi:MAG: hypothetical protein GOV01_00035 [Candidatus Altiarchaeota archaeon]|nr:hypothetical protein [Candidatus Altiarchaeota archaeon]
MGSVLLYAIIFLIFLYYVRRRRFEVAYTLFLSGLVGVTLKYLVSDTLTFTTAPPNLNVMFLATLSVFNGFFWLLTLVYFMLGMGNPLNAVAGLLLGYGLGKWHVIRKKKLILETGEVKRKVFHAAFGVLIAIPPFFIDKRIILPIYFTGMLFLLVIKYVKLPIITTVLYETKRETEWPGRGAFFFFLGSLLPIYLGQPWIILVLGIGDGLSTLIGKFFGYTPLYKNKSVEGTFAGFIGAWAIARHFYSPVILPAILFLIAEVWAPIDDNFAIPVALSMLYLF